MATRSIIKIKGFKTCALHKHWDGYPESTLPWLKHFAKRFVEKRGNDPQYMMAQLVRSSASLASEFGLDDSDLTGWGIVPYDAMMGQEYTYVLCPETGNVDIE